jgi:outer membrane protein OmpA-like peptidoglycan-associated protein
MTPGANQEDPMRDFNRIERVGESGWTEHGPFEAEQFFGEGEEWSAGPAGETFGEAERLEFASELLEVTSDAELDGVLRDLIGRVGQAVGRIISAPEGNAIGSVLKGAAKRVLSGIGGDMPQSAGREFGLELEGLSNEDREFEIARSYVDFADAAVRNLASRPPFLHPEEAADAAVVEAAKTHAPGLLSWGGAWNHAFSATNPASPLTESEFDLTLGARPKPLSLRFMNLDKFIWNRATLTPDTRQKIELLAKEVKLSWATTRPIGYVMLVGHTDNTGPEAYNHDLGNWRAGEVKKALESLLTDEILKRRVAIIVEQSPGASSPTADNGTDSGRALNRRVEVFVAPPEPAPPPPPIIDWTPPDPNPPPPPVFDWRKTIGKGPPQGKSVDEWLDSILSNIGLPKFARTQIANAIYNKNWGLLSQLLEQAHISGDLKDAIINAAHGVGETRAH